MFSLQKLLGKEDKFYTLLEASAQEARNSVQALVKLSKSFDQPVVLDEFIHSRRKDKQITADISEAVYTTFITALESEADKHMMTLYKELFSGKHEPLQVIVLKALYELLEKVIDRCRDSGNVIAHIVLKSS